MTRNLELALVVERRASRGRPDRDAPGNVAAALRELRLAELIARPFDPAAIRKLFRCDAEGILVETKGGAARLPMRHLWRFRPEAGIFRLDAAVDPEGLIRRLSSCVVRDARAEIGILLTIVTGVSDPREGGFCSPRRCASSPP